MADTSVKAAPTLRETRRQRLTEDIRRAALERFVEQGYESTTVEEICNDVGVSLRTFYRHFDDKGALLSHISATGEREIAAHMAAAPADLSFVDAFETGLGVALGAFRQDPERTRRILATFTAMPGYLTHHWVDGKDEPDAMELEIARRLGLDPMDAKVRLFRGFVGMCVIEATSQWSRNPVSGLYEAVRENLLLARALERSITQR